MNDHFKKWLKRLGILFGILLLIIICYIIYVFSSYYRLEDKQILTISGASAEKAKHDMTYRITSGNIGFGAYSDDYSFFMDGGKESRAYSKEAVIENVTSYTTAVAKLHPDFALFQEVDIDGTRSYHIDQRPFILTVLPEKDIPQVHTFAQNYDSPYLFYPILEPHGKNKAGLLTVSTMEITQSVRRSLPVEGGFMKLLDLDRCYSVNRIPVDNGKELLLYNLHLSAYTSDPSTADKQLKMLFNDMKAEYDAGNYIVAGGDFNKDLLGNSAEIFGHEELEENWAKPIPKKLIPDFIQLIAPFDKENPVPSCRNADQPYNESNFVVTVDGFLVSDNVTVKNALVLDTKFQWSDHNPVYMDFVLTD